MGGLSHGMLYTHMRVFIWQSFCSNNSGAYHLVARFGSPQLATEVATELREFFAAHDDSEDQELSEAMVTARR